MKRRRVKVSEEDEVEEFAPSTACSLPFTSPASLLSELTRPLVSSECINPRRSKDIRIWLERWMWIPSLLLLADVPITELCDFDPVSRYRCLCSAEAQAVESPPPSR